MGCSSILCQCSRTSTMFSNLKQSLLSDEVNPITKVYEIQKLVATAGTEMVWKIHDAIRLSDKKSASVFIFDKKRANKLHKPRRRETVTEILRTAVRHLERIKHPRILQILHPIEECHDSLAFASEPIMASLANLLGSNDHLPNSICHDLKNFEFIELEVKYGVHQIAEALSYLQGFEKVMHGNLSPASIVITKRGTWKMLGFGFLAKIKDGQENIYIQPWSTKVAKLAQPDLDYIAPEIQMERQGCRQSDIFSLGLTICAIYNNGHSLLESQKNTVNYSKKFDQLEDTFNGVVQRMPVGLVEPVEKMINRDSRYRPSPQLLCFMKYFNDPEVVCLEQLDSMDLKDLSFKKETYSKLIQVIPNFPKEILYRHVFPVIQDECRNQDSVMYALPPLLTMVDCASKEEYTANILPLLKAIFSMPKPIQATSYLLDKLEIILEKSDRDDVKTVILPLIFNTLDSSSMQGQEAALNCVSKIDEYLDESVVKKMVLPRAKSLFHKATNVKIRVTTLKCIDGLLDNLEKMTILDNVLPFLTEISCNDPEVVMVIIGIYKHMLSEKKFGLTHNLIASKVMPPLIPQTVNPGLNIEQFGSLMEVLREMLDHIDRQRRHKMLQETSPTNAAVRGSLKMRANINLDDRFKYVGMNDKMYRSRTGYYTSPSTPELVQRTSVTGTPDQPRKNNSLASLGGGSLTAQDEKNLSSDSIRRYSLVPPGLYTPAIGLIPDDYEHERRRPSTQSMGPLTIPGEDDMDRPRRPSTHSLGPIPSSNRATNRRSSRSGSIFGTLIQMGPEAERRPSFSSISESVMQFLSGK